MKRKGTITISGRKGSSNCGNLLGIIFSFLPDRTIKHFELYPILRNPSEDTIYVDGRRMQRRSSTPGCRENV